MEVNNESLTTTSYTTNVLKSGSSYKWNVRAIDINNKGGWLSDSFYFITRVGIGEAINTTALKIQLVDEIGLPIPNRVVSVNCATVDNKPCSTGNELAASLNPIANSVGYINFFQKGLESWQKLSVSTTQDGVNYDNIYAFVKDIVVNAIHVIKLQQVSDAGVLSGFLLGAKNLVTGALDVVYSLGVGTNILLTSPSEFFYRFDLVIDDFSWSNIYKGISESVRGRAATIVYLDPDNYVTFYNASKAYGQTVFDVCTIACTIGNGLAIKGTQVAKASIDVSKTADAAVATASVRNHASLPQILNNQFPLALPSGYPHRAGKCRKPAGFHIN